MKRITLPLLVAALLASPPGFGARKQGTAPQPPTNSAAPPPASSPSAFRKNQPIRVGLTTQRDKVTIACSAGLFRANDPATGRPVWKESYASPLTIGIRGAAPTAGRIYRAQVGSFDKKDAADELAARLTTLVSEPVVVAWSPDRKVWRIRVGAGDDREALAGVVAKLRAAGFPDAWIADEPVPQSAPGTLILLDASYDTQVLSVSAVLFEAADPGALLSVDGAAYRGTLEVRLDAAGAVRVVDILPIESYLRGVVPSELGPVVYPEIEALKAQTIAARTYVYRNLGQFAEEGFDLCDTPRCQVYGGVKAEHSLSDRAIQETEGEIATFHGAPINALYTSTCGGHTEDASNIFVEDTAPYLIGVPCAPEERSRKTRRIVLEGDAALASAVNASAAEATALLAVHGILPRSAVQGSRLDEQVTETQASEWIEQVGAACGLTAGASKNKRARAPSHPARAHGADPSAEILPSAAGDSESAGPNDGKEPAGSGLGTSGKRTAHPSLAFLADSLIDRLGWGGRVDLLVDREDAQSWLMDDPVALPADQAGAVAYFLRAGAWPPDSNGSPNPARTATRGDLARLLLFAAQDCALLDLREGIVRGGDAGSLRLSTKGVLAAMPLAADSLIFADFGSGPVPVQRVGVVIGDKVRYHAGSGDRIDEMTLLPGRQGLSDDRYSNTSTWTVAYSAEDLAKKLDDYLGSGQLQDIAVVRRGVSGRVTELKVVGTNGEAVIRGFPIRTALGLKENLFIINKQRDKSGALRRVVFTGRGWGHGVGMCQVGAYGMALRGLSYREILTHYYTGISLERLP